MLRFLAKAHRRIPCSEFVVRSDGELIEFTVRQRHGEIVHEATCEFVRSAAEGEAIEDLALERLEKELQRKIARRLQYLRAEGRYDWTPRPRAA